MKKRKIILIIISPILLIIIVTLIYSQTNNFRNNLKLGIEYYANKSINGNLKIRSIEGNIFTGLKINEIELKDKLNNKIAYIHSISGYWDLKKLIDKTLLIETLQLDSLNIYISQEKDLSYPIQKLIKEKKSDTTHTSLPITININEFKILRSTAFINLIKQENIPKSIRMNSSISAIIKQDSNTLVIKKLSLKSKSPNFQILNFKTNILHTPSLLKIQDLKINTNKTAVIADAKIPLNNIIESTVNIKLKPLCLDEFKDFIHQNIQGSPEIELQFQKLESLSYFTLKIKEQKQNININGNINSLNANANYKANLHSHQFNLGYWIGNNELQTNINGQISIKGTGVDPQKMNSVLALKLESSSVNNIEISKAHILAKINKGKYTIDTLILNNKDIDIIANGNGYSDHINTCKYKVNIRSLNTISSLINIPPIDFNGLIEGEISGHKDSIIFQSKINLSKIKYNNVRIKKIKSIANISLIKEQLNGSLDLELNDAELNKNITINLLKSRQNIKNNVLEGQYKIQSGDSIELNTHLRINKEKDINIQISQFSLNAYSQNWTNKIDTTYCILKPDKVTITDFNLSDKEQHIKLNGIYSFKEQEEKYIHLLSENLDLSRFNKLLEKGQEINGKLNTNLKIKIENEKLDYSGKIKLTEGSLKAKRQGINFDNINMDISLKEDNIYIDSLYISSDKKGYLAIKGKVNIPKSYNELMQEIDINIKAENFIAIKSYKNQLIFNANSQIKGSINNPIISGGLTIVRGKMNIDHFIENEAVKDLDKPLLIEALENDKKQNSLLLTSDTTLIKVDSSKLIDTDIFKNLRGEFYIDFPKNTWIEGSQMKLELSGHIKMIKTKEEPEFFGNISLTRGFVEISGRKFKIKKGNITLSGGDEINPSIDIAMQYLFRDANKKLESLELLVGGTVKKPTFAFTLNKEFIEEKDAISYLIFGKKVDQLGSRDQEKVSSKKDKLKPIIYSQISNIFQKVLAKSLGLDNIEISGEDNWESGSITFGKYLTNDLYMSYSQLFSMDSQNKELIPYRIIIEYHIMRSLLIQTTNEGNKSGFDLIWKLKL
ncbi:MAG: translocation/assembly module TamB domain-containing protein [Marinifilaceae bacterium]